jgi:hypothetical protein
MELVRQLGHKSFQVREEAARELKKRGGDAATALAAGMKDADPEVAERCKSLYPAAAAEVRKSNLVVLVNKPDSRPPKGLAGLERFLAITGDDKAARQLYAEMMAARPDVIEAMEKDPHAGSRLMGDFFEKAGERWQKADDIAKSCDAILRDHGESALFLFVRSDPRFVDDPEYVNVAHSIVAATKLRGALAGPQTVPGVKKLFVHWLNAEPRMDIAGFAFSIAESENVKEALPTALRIVTNTKYPSGYRAELMIGYVAKFGGKEHVKDLAPFLTDTESLGSNQLNDEPERFMQFRDLALAASIQLAGEKLTDFGLRDDDRYGFPNDAARDAAFAKWKAWTERQGESAKK